MHKFNGKCKRECQPASGKYRHRKKVQADVRRVNVPAGGSDVDGTLIISKGDGANKLHKLAFAAGMKKARLCSAHSHRTLHFIFSLPSVFLYLAACWHTLHEPRRRCCNDCRGVLAPYSAQNPRQPMLLNHYFSLTSTELVPYCRSVGKGFQILLLTAFDHEQVAPRAQTTIVYRSNIIPKARQQRWRVQVFGVDTNIDVIKHHGSTDPLILI